MPIQQEIRVKTEFIYPKDYPEIMRIETESFEFPWPEDDFRRSLRLKNDSGMLARYEGRVVGYSIYEFFKTKIHLLNFAVAPEHRRKGVGSQMVAKLIDKLSLQRRSKIILEVRETNLTAQFFFYSCGFMAVNILRNFYDDTPEDAYVFRYALEIQPSGEQPVLENITRASKGECGK